MLQVNQPIVVNMKGELVFDLEKYSKHGLDVYDYDQTFESTFFALPFDIYFSIASYANIIRHQPLSCSIH